MLVDAPPCLEFADARIMARYAEKLLLVVRADYTERKTAQSGRATAAAGRNSRDGCRSSTVGIRRTAIVYGYCPIPSQDLRVSTSEIICQLDLPRCAGRLGGCPVPARAADPGCRNRAGDKRPVSALEFCLDPDRKRGIRRLPMGSDCGAGKVGQFLHGRAILPGLAIATPVLMFTNLHLRAVQATDARRLSSFGEYLRLRARHDAGRPGRDRWYCLARKLSNGKPRR